MSRVLMAKQIHNGVNCAGVETETYEEHRCLACQSAIEMGHVGVKYDAKRADAQTVLIHCVHCDAVYSVDRRLRSGVWQIVGMVAALRQDDATRREFLREIEKLHGDVQLTEIDSDLLDRRIAATRDQLRRLESARSAQRAAARKQSQAEELEELEKGFRQRLDEDQSEPARDYQE